MNPDNFFLLNDRFRQTTERGSEAQPIGDVLAELLAQYQAKYPEMKLTVVETPSAT